MTSHHNLRHRIWCLRPPPSGSGVPTFRALTISDLPSIPLASTSGILNVAQGGTGVSTLPANTLPLVNGTGTGLIGMTCAINEVLKWDGTAWVCSAMPGGGWQNGTNTFGAPASLGTADNFQLNFLTNSAIRMSIANNGLVGIGTTAPAAALHVKTLWNNAGSDFHGIKLDVDTGTASALSTLLDFKIAGASKFTVAKGGEIWLPNGTASNPAIVGRIQIDSGFFFPTFGVVATSTSGVERMRVDASGNVGIGTTSPTTKLDVGGDIKFSGKLVSSNSNAPGLTCGGASAVVMAGGNQVRGTIEITSGTPSSCDITFDSPPGTCVFTWVNTPSGTLLNISNISGNTLTVTTSGSFPTGAKFNYICLQ